MNGIAPIAGTTPDARGGVALAWLLAVGLVLRSIGLDSDLWHDELFTWLDLVKLPLLDLWSTYPDDNQHLVYSLAARVCVLAFGESPAVLRLPAVAFGVASLWATWRLGVQTVSRRHALFATALLTFSYHHVWFSQDARGYTALLLATVLSTDLLLRALRTDRTRTWVLYAAVLAFGMGAHLTMIFVALAQGLVVIAYVASRETRRLGVHAIAALLLGGLLTLLLHAPLLGEMIDFYLQPSAGATTAQVAWKSPLWLANEAIRSFGVPLALGWAAAAAASLPLVWGLASLWRRSRSAAALFVLPALLGFASLLLLDRNLWPRFFFNSFGFIAILAVSGIGEGFAWIRARWRAPGWLPTAALVLLVAASAVTVPRNYLLPKMDYRGARNWVEAHAAPDDAIVALDLAGDAYARYYAPRFATADTLDELRAVASEHGDTWVVYAFGDYIAAREPDLWETLLGLDEVGAFPGTLGGGALVVRRAPPGALASPR